MIEYLQKLNWEEFIKLLKNQTNGSSNSSSDPDWYGSDTYEQALGFLDYWPGYKDVMNVHINERAFYKVFPREDYKKVIARDIIGQQYDIGQYIVGLPDCCLVETSEKDLVVQGKKLITLYAFASTNCMTTREGFLYRGALMFRLVDYLETIGASVRLFVVSAITNISRGCDKIVTIVEIKRHGELFDKNKCSLALSSPVFLRRYIFHVWEQLDDKLRNKYGIKVAGGYGYPTLLEDEDIFNDGYVLRLHNSNNKIVVGEIFLKFLKSIGEVKENIW